MRIQDSVENVPRDEKSSQVGQKDFERLNTIECAVWIGQLNRKFKRLPAGMYFRVQKNSHDAGPYKDVAISYLDTEQHEKRATEIINNLPVNWDPFALETLKKMGYWDDKPVMIKMQDQPDHVKEAIKIVEEYGGIVILQEEPHEDTTVDPENMEELKEDNPRLTLQQTAELHGYSNILDLIEAYFIEDLVPACCKNMCEVETDGQCSHGCPSIILEMGLI